MTNSPAGAQSATVCCPLETVELAVGAGPIAELLGDAVPPSSREPVRVDGKSVAVPVPVSSEDALVGLSAERGLELGACPRTCATTSRRMAHTRNGRARSIF